MMVSKYGTMRKNRTLVMVSTTQTNAFPVRFSSYEPAGGKSTLAHLFCFNYIRIIIGKYDTMLKTTKNLEMVFYHTKKNPGLIFVHTNP